MFCENLKKARLDKKMSQRALAEKIFISQQAYAKYEIGTASPNPEMLTAISNVLEVSVDYLLGKSDQKEKPAIYGELDEDQKAAYELIISLSPEERAAAEAYIDFLLSQRGKNG